MDSNAVRVRFAPSPTGYLHIGGARTALFNWLTARQSPQGRFILRIEDTDRSRHVADSVQKILSDLRWLGLTWDEGPEVGGDHGPYFQGERLEIYQRYTRRLLDEGKAYYAMESQEQLAAMRAAAQKSSGGFKYPRPDPLPTVAEGEAAREAGRSVVVRLKMPDRDITVADDILGEVVMRCEELEDFVIQKADGWPTYHMACVIDDALMEVTHVLRGQEHLMNTPKHIALQEAMGFPQPRYAHLPLIFNMSGTKMSKRDKHRTVRDAVKLGIRQGRWTVTDVETHAGCDHDRAERWLSGADAELEGAALDALAAWTGVTVPEIDVHDFRAAGYLPEAVLSFISLLGWSTGEEQEQLTLEETVRRFDYRAINKGNARFDRNKLLAFNTDWAARLHEDRLVAAFKDYLNIAGSPMGQLDDDLLRRVLRLCEGFRTFRDVENKAGFAFVEDSAIVYDEKAVRKVLEKDNGQGYAMLDAVLEVIEGIEPWKADRLEAALQELCERREVKLGAVAQPLRVALSGTTVSPAIYDTLELVGPSRTCRRIRNTLKMRKVE